MQCVRLAVLITCHNRAATTISNLGTLIDALAGIAWLKVRVFLVDDGSVDRTGERIREKYPDVTVILGNGSLFWNRGMRLSYDAANGSGSCLDCYLLFNDDVAVDAQAVQRMASAFRRGVDLHHDYVLVGGTVSSVGELTYSGYHLRSQKRPLSLRMVEPSGAMVPVDTFNGNFVLVSGELMKRVGGIDAVYWHALGDIDLGLRCLKAGSVMELYKHSIGVCARGPSLRSRLRRLRRLDRLRTLTVGEYGLWQYLYFYWRHGPKILFPVYLVKVIGNTVGLVAL